MRFETQAPKGSRGQAIADASDWAGVTASEAASMAFSLSMVRRFEEAVLDLDKIGLVHGPAHSSIGQDGGAVGCMAALPADTLMNGSHRAHHQVLAKTVRACWPDDFDPRTAEAIPDTMRAETEGMLAEILGLDPGWMGGDRKSVV